jgi:hypothetical protein
MCGYSPSNRVKQYNVFTTLATAALAAVGSSNNLRRAREHAYSAATYDNAVAHGETAYSKYRKQSLAQAKRDVTAAIEAKEIVPDEILKAFGIKPALPARAPKFTPAQQRWLTAVHGVVFPKPEPRKRATRKKA